MDKYCWQEIGQFINEGKEILNVSFNEQVREVLSSKTLLFKMCSDIRVNVVDTNNNLCILVQSKHDSDKCYKIVIGRGETQYVYCSCKQRYEDNNFPGLLATFSDELQSFITSLINNITILDSIFNINKQKYEEVIGDWGRFTLNKLREIQQTKYNEIKFRRNKFIIKALNLPFIQGIMHSSSVMTFTVDRKSVKVKFDVGKFDEYTFIIYDDKNKREYYKYSAIDKKIKSTIPDEKYTNYSKDVKHVISIFSNPNTFNKTSALERIYNYHEKLRSTPFLYNYEKCILILLAAKHRQFCNVPYDVAKIIAYWILQ